MVQETQEMRDLAKSAANAYVSGLKLMDATEAVDRFIDAYDYAIKKLWLREHKEEAMKELVGDSSTVKTSENQ